MATKTTYPNSTKPAAPAGVAQVIYGGAPVAGVPASDPGDRIGDGSEFIPAPMPRVQATPNEARFADDVLALRRRLVDAIHAERATPQVAAVALMATAVDLTGEQNEAELRAHVEATAREFTGTGEEPGAPTT
jgi:hypothetical protein